MLNGIAEYINVDYDKEYLMRKHNEVRIGTSLYNEIRDISSHDYVECGTESHILKINPDYYRQWDHILTIMSGVNIGMCEHGTGFNSNATLTSGVPPHIDFDEREGNQFNLLLPMYGVAKINIYETIQEQLEYRHGMMHWNMSAQMINWLPRIARGNWSLCLVHDGLDILDPWGAQAMQGILRIPKGVSGHPKTIPREFQGLPRGTPKGLPRDPNRRKGVHGPKGNQ